MSVNGKGRLADSYSNILSHTESLQVEMDSIAACVPRPQEPNWETYYNIRK